MMPGQISTERISSTAFLDSGISGRADIGHAAKMRVRGFDSSQGLLHYSLFCATDQDTTNCKNYCKVKAFRHLQHRGLPYHRSSAGQVIISSKAMPGAALHGAYWQQ